MVEATVRACPMPALSCRRFSAPLFPDYHGSSLPRWILSEASRLLAAEYRLCPKGKNITEECFQQMPLEPATDKQYIAYGAIKIEPPGTTHKKNITEITGTYVKEGTKPAGSTWIRNPIPACYGPGGGAEMSDCDGPQFPPAIPGLYGFGPGRCTSGLPYNFRGQHKYCTPHSLSSSKLRTLSERLSRCADNCSLQEYEYWLDLFNFNIVDTLKVPDVPGEYVLSFRWDCEQTPQIWAGCSDIISAPHAAPLCLFASL